MNLQHILQFNSWILADDLDIANLESRCWPSQYRYQQAGRNSLSVGPGDPEEPSVW